MIAVGRCKVKEGENQGILMGDVTDIIKKVRIYDVLIYIAFIIFMIMAVKNKVNMHVDEVCSYGLSNSTQGGYFVCSDIYAYVYYDHVLGHRSDVCGNKADRIEE